MKQAKILTSINFLKTSNGTMKEKIEIIYSEVVGDGMGAVAELHCNRTALNC
jgi:hypothetical protein